MIFEWSLKRYGNQTIIETWHQDSDNDDPNLRISASIKLNGGKEFLSTADRDEGVRDFGEFKGFRL